MGRRPNPPELRLIRGSVRSNRPNRRMAAINPALGPPQPPTFLSAAARQEWERVCPLLFKAGLLTAIDGALLAAYCMSFARWREAEQLLAQPAADLLVAAVSKDRQVPNPLVGIAARAMRDAMRFASELGMVPGTRSKIHAVPPPPDVDGDDPANKYLA
jgi:P27 family predicted phage terminase small subunit